MKQRVGMEPRRHEEHEVGTGQGLFCVLCVLLRSKLFLSIGMLLLCCGASLAGSVEVLGGTLANAERLVVDQLIVRPGAELQGHGTVQAQVAVEGCISPSGMQTGLVGTLVVEGTLQFSPGSRFEGVCTSHTVLDQLIVSGEAGGHCTVAYQTDSAAIPLEQTIIDGGASSSYSGFVTDEPGTWGLSPSGSNDLALTHLQGDTDLDGMPDWWENEHFAHRSDASATGNNDGDAHDNLAEYLADTHPLDANSLLGITALTFSNSWVEVEWQGGRDCVQYLESTTNLALFGSWQTLMTNLPPTAPIESWAHTDPNTSARFYRLRVVR